MPHPSEGATGVGTAMPALSEYHSASPTKPTRTAAPSTKNTKISHTLVSLSFFIPPNLCRYAAEVNRLRQLTIARLQSTCSLRKAIENWVPPMSLTSVRYLFALLCLMLGNSAFSQVTKPLTAPDEPLDAGFEAFYSVKQKVVADRTNAAVGLAGITAPKGVDIFSFGRAEIDQAKKDAELEATYAINPFFGKPTPTPPKKKEVSSGLRFEASGAERECLQALTNESAIQPHADCASTKVVQAVWSKNALLLAR
jgi:hypothetical protein